MSPASIDDGGVRGCRLPSKASSPRVAGQGQDAPPAQEMVVAFETGDQVVEDRRFLAGAEDLRRGHLHVPLRIGQRPLQRRVGLRAAAGRRRRDGDAEDQVCTWHCLSLTKGVE